MEEFTIETEEHNCFLCSESCSSVKWESNLDDSASSATYSIQHLSRYLKLDMRKVFNEEGPIAPQLLEKVKRAQLKVELCEECTYLNTTFSTLYRKLEKVEMEVKSCLNLIHTKFLKGKKSTKPNQKDDFNGRKQIVENLRNDGIEKCATKLREASLRLRIKNLTRKQIIAEKYKLSTIARKNKRQASRSETFGDADVHRRPKWENQSSDVIINATNDNDKDSCLDYTDNMESEEAFEQSNSDVDAEEEHPLGQGTEKIKQENEQMLAASSSTKSVGSWPQSRPAEKKYTLNPLTGKYKCMLCPMEFKQRFGSICHYNNVHLKTKFKCNLCGKEFTQRHHFQRHHKSVHMGVRYKCLGCNKEFTYKHHLTTHQRKTSCGIIEMN